MNVRTLALLATLAASTANAVIINIDSTYGFTYDGGGSDPAPVPGQHLNPIGAPPLHISLSAGTWRITNATGLLGAAHTAWSYNTGTSSWAWAFVMYDAATNNTMLYSEAGFGNSAAAVAALPAVQNFSTTFTLPAFSTVGFTLRDFNVSDNAGGISIDIQPVRDAGVPEPSSYALLLTAGGIGCFLRRFRSSRG